MTGNKVVNKITKFKAQRHHDDRKTLQALELTHKQVLLVIKVHILLVTLDSSHLPSKLGFIGTFMRDTIYSL